jgi:ribosomal protein S27AE
MRERTGSESTREKEKRRKKWEWEKCKKKSALITLGEVADWSIERSNWISCNANPRSQLSQIVVDREGATREKNKCERCGWSVLIGENRDPIKMHEVSIQVSKNNRRIVAWNHWMLKQMCGSLIG